MIDLHLHSTFSDGSYTPEQLVEMAVKAELTALALTDHDSTNGIDRFLQACQKAGIRGIPGVEISADVKEGTMHILGYFVDHRESGLQKVLESIREGRTRRNEEILQKLNQIGCKLTMEEVAHFAGEDVVGRPHFARAMMWKGYVATNEEAFEKYLGKGRPAYADRFRLSPKDSIQTILHAGGIPVLSHPVTLELGHADLMDLLKTLHEVGLQGLEVYYSEHRPELMKEYHAMARDLDLVATGGSDFHGETNPAIQIGVGFGGLKVPDSVVDALLTRLPV